jgi:hypothetical protein
MGSRLRRCLRTSFSSNGLLNDPARTLNPSPPWAGCNAFPLGARSQNRRLLGWIGCDLGTPMQRRDVTVTVLGGAAIVSTLVARAAIGQDERIAIVRPSEKIGGR